MMSAGRLLFDDTNLKKTHMLVALATPTIVTTTSTNLVCTPHTSRNR
jgi:hypothetical protein